MTSSNLTSTSSNPIPTPSNPTPSNLFLDNNVCIKWLINKDPEISKFIDENKKINFSVYTSEYVMAEFIRTIVVDACNLHAILENETNIPAVISIIYNMFKRDDKIPIARRCIILMESINYPNGPEIEYARRITKYYARSILKKFQDNIEILESKVKCKLSSEKPKRTGNRFVVDIPCGSTNPSECSIPTYIQNELSFLNKIETGIRGESEPYYKKLAKLISDFNTLPTITCHINCCKILGDVIMINDCPNGYDIVSTDHHFEVLCGISNHTLINQF